MTIKRSYIDYGNIFRRRYEPKEKILRPGYREQVTIITYDYDARDYSVESVIFKVDSSDDVVMIPQRVNNEFMYPAAHIIQPGESVTYHGDEINVIIDPQWGDVILNKKGHEITFRWEPTLPNQARK